MRLPEHGANPRHVYAAVGIESPAHMVDFSENCNPEGPPQTVVDSWAALAGQLHRYPDPAGEPFLSRVAAFHGMSVESMIVGNGAAEILSLIAGRYQGKRAIVVHPTFSEYEATLRANAVEIERIIALEADGFALPVHSIERKLKGASVLYICTPNNPTGVMPTKADLLSLIEKAGEADCEVVLDEAFIDFVDEGRSFIQKVSAFPHCMVVRSMTKMYAIPGIRLGYAVAHSAVISELKSRAPHWNVNGVAAAIGALCLDEEAYRGRAIRHAAEQRVKMTTFLQSYGCIVTDSHANFLSFRLREGLDARELYVDMLKRGIVLRHSGNFVGMDGRWLRIGMKGERELGQLKRELADWFRVR